MPSEKDYYEILGVSKTATPQEIKSAYRRLARKYHPDVNPGADSEERFKEINIAYEVLKDEEKRARYDQFGTADAQAGFGGAGFGSDMGFGDLFDMFFGGGMQQGHAQRADMPEQGSDLRYDLEITLEQAAFGFDTDLEYAHLEQCDACHGTGAKPGTHAETCSMCHGSGQVRRTQNTLLGSFSSVTTCPNCHGEGRTLSHPCLACGGQGRVRKARKVSVTIPPGVDSGSRLRLQNEGDAGVHGGPAGDLHIFIHVKNHQRYQRKGRDLACEESITFTQASLGDKFKVKTLEGETDLIVPPGTQPGTIFRIHGKGMPQVGSKAHGDLYVTVHITTPQKLTEKQKEILLQFAKERGEKIEPQEDKNIFERVKEALGGR